MPRGRPRKIVKTTQDDIREEDIVQSTDSEGEAKKSKNTYNKGTKGNTPQNFNTKPSYSSNIQNIPPVHTQNVLPIEQIKRRILRYAPEMQDQINNVLDDDTLREVYYEQIQAKLIAEESEPKKIERGPQILKMIEEILENVPGMQDQVDALTNEEIKEIYEETISITNGMKANQPQLMQKNSQKYNMAEIKKFIMEKVPDMIGEMNTLEDDDIIEVYNDYLRRQAEQRQRKIANPIPPSSMQRQPPRPQMTPKSQISNHSYQDPYEDFDPMRKYKKEVKEEEIVQKRTNNPYKNPPSFDNYGYPKQIQPKYQPSYEPERNLYSSSHEVFNFHNNKRVMASPLDAQRLPKTVIIVHTIEPGYLPPPKPKCRCDCCVRREFDLKDPTYIDEFIHTVLLKNSMQRR